MALQYSTAANRHTMQRVRHDNVTNDVQTQNRHNTRMRMRTHNAKPREREKKTISLHGRNQIMTKGIERLGRKGGRLELPEIVGVPDNSAAPFESASAVC
jgi:hypothetical protein